MAKCDIIIPVWNQLEYTKECVASIVAHTGEECSSIIFVDNASKKETKEYLASLENALPIPAVVIRNETNLGFVKAANQGIEWSRSPCLCVLNNDTVVTAGWLKSMLEVLASADDIGIVNPSSNNLGQRPAKGQSVEDYAGTLRADEDLYQELGACIGFCMLIKREVLDKTGVFDEVYGMGNFEDTDLCRKAVKAGYRCVRACRAYVYHRENASFRLLPNFSDDFARNREIFEFRWGKPQRVAYILDRLDRPLCMRVSAEALDLARHGDRVWFFSKKAFDPPAHAGIMSVPLPEERFYLRAVFGILKKKKKFSEIFVGDERLGKILEILSFLHRAKISYY